MTGIRPITQCRLVVVTCQPSVQNDRPKLDVGPFVKLGDPTAAGRDRELRAQTGCSRPSRADNENPRSKLRGIGYRVAIRLTSFRLKGERPKGRGIYPT